MRIKNTTTISTVLLREIIRFVAPPGISGYDVRLSNCSEGTITGKAYYAGSGYHDTASPFVVLYIGRPQRFPSPPVPIRKGYLPLPWFGDREEALVYLAAHELRHLWQARVPRGRRVWGSRGQFSERDACAYGIRKLREWRRHERHPIEAAASARLRPSG